MRLPVALGVTSRVKKTTNWSGFAPLKNGPATVSPLKVLSETQSSDFLITGSWPAVSLPSPSTETISGAYRVRMTSKFLPCLHNSTNWLATVLTLIDDLQFRRPWQPQKTARPRIPGDAGGVFRSPVYAFYRSAWSG